MSILYPWQHDQWSSVTKMVTDQRLPHALLLAGPAGMGKQHFATTLANYMVCRHKKENMFCGACKDCLLFQAGTHPDIVNICSEETFKQIRIEQVRNMASFLGCRSNQGGYRVVTIFPAEDMNIYAANALLKTLEEPGADILILLVSSRPEILLPTIRSRCQQLKFSLPTKTEVLAWLKQQLTDQADIESVLEMAQGRPLVALRYIREHFREKWRLLVQGLRAILIDEKSLVEISTKWKALDSLFIFEWMIFSVAAIIRYKMTRQINQLPAWSQDEVFLSCIKRCPVKVLMQYYQWLTENYALLTKRIHLNSQLLSEALLVHWQKISLS